MKVLIVGSSGQLGNALIKSSPTNYHLLTPPRNLFDLNLSDNCYEYIIKKKPDWVINAGAYTNVDKAEKEKNIAYQINAKAPESIAKAILKIGGKLLHISTDYVFSGIQNFPYLPNQKTSPINAYGITKAKGEDYLTEILKENNQLAILRTSWLMGKNGKNFAKTMLKLHNERDIIKVVYDQVGSPTTTSSLSKAIWRLISINDSYSEQNKIFPTYNHFSDGGIASKYDIAVEVGKIGLQKGLINKVAYVKPILSSEYPTAAKRPYYSVLESSETIKLLNLQTKYWRDCLFEEFIL